MGFLRIATTHSRSAALRRHRSLVPVTTTIGVSKASVCSWSSTSTPFGLGISRSKTMQSGEPERPSSRKCWLEAYSMTLYSAHCSTVLKVRRTPSLSSTMVMRLDICFNLSRFRTRPSALRSVSHEPGHLVEHTANDDVLHSGILRKGVGLNCGEAKRTQVECSAVSVLAKAHFEVSQRVVPSAN